MSQIQLKREFTFSHNEDNDSAVQSQRNISDYMSYKVNHSKQIPKNNNQNNKTSTSILASYSPLNNSHIQPKENQSVLYPTNRDMNEKHKQPHNQPNFLKDQINRRIFKKVASKLNTSSSYINNNFLNKSKDLIDLICSSPKKDNATNRKMPSLVKQKKSHNMSVRYSSNAIYDQLCNSNKKKSHMKSLSQQKINDLTRLLNKDVRKTNRYNCEEDNDRKTSRKPFPLFKADIKARIKDKLFDLKKFKFSINYQERKEDPEKRKEFAKNNLCIIEKIKNQVNEGRFSNDEDINIDDLVEVLDYKRDVRPFNAQDEEELNEEQLRQSYHYNQHHDHQHHDHDHHHHYHNNEQDSNQYCYEMI